MVSRKGVKKAVKRDLESAGHDMTMAGEKVEGALKTAGRDMKKAGKKIRKRV